jgi:hypothetical protein
MTSVSSVGFQDFGDFGGGNFASYLAALNNGTPPPPPPPNTTQANNPTTMTAAELREWQVNQIWAQHFPEIEVFPPGLIVYTADETIYMHFRPEFAAQVEALDLAAYSRSIVKQYGVLWEEYHVRVLAERQSQMLVSGAREEGYNAQGDYGFSLEYSGGNWGRNSGGVFAAADRAYNAYGGGGSGFNYLDFVSSYVSGQVNPNEANGFYYTPQTVRGSTGTNAEGEEVLIATATRGVWVPLGGVSQYSPLYTPIGNARAGQNQTNQAVLPFPALPPSASVLTAADQLNLNPVFHREVPNDAEFSAALAIVAAVLRNPRASRVIFESE